MPPEPAGSFAISDRIATHFQGRWMQGYARGKLRRDPVFAAAFESLKDSVLPVLDIGCGIGLLEFYLRERGFQPPMVGIDFDARKIAQARGVAGGHYSEINFQIGDVQEAGSFEGNVVLVDVLHYLPVARQRPLLEQLAARVAPGGFCLIRATPRDESWRFRVTQVEEFFLRATLWMKSGAIHYPTIEETLAPFRERGFRCEVRPLWGRTPFNSHLFVLRA